MLIRDEYNKIINAFSIYFFFFCYLYNIIKYITRLHYAALPMKGVNKIRFSNNDQILLRTTWTTSRRCLLYNRTRRSTRMMTRVPAVSQFCSRNR